MKSIGSFIIGIILLLPGFFFISLGVNQWMEDRNAQQTYQQAVAVVTGHVCQAAMTGPNSYTTNCEEYQFQTKDGKTISFGENIPKYQVGQQVPVYYDPSDPAYTATLSVNNSIATAFELILGIPFVVAGLVLIVKSFGKKKAQHRK